MQERFKAYNVNSVCHFTAINLINSAKLPSPLIASHHPTYCMCFIQMTENPKNNNKKMVKMTSKCEIKSYFEAMQITIQQHHALPPGGGEGGGTQQSSIQGGSAPRSNPLPSYEITF